MTSTLKILGILLMLSSSGLAKSRRHMHQIPPAFPPSIRSLILQNQVIEQLHLSRVSDDKHLKNLVESGELVAIEETEYVSVSSTLPRNRRFVRPWVNQFLREIGTAYYSEFGVPIQVNSAVRTVKVQNRLRRMLGRTAALSKGETASSHLAGLTVDLKRTGLSYMQLVWMQEYLRYAGNQVIVEEEKRCFHTLVKPKEPCPEGYLVDFSCTEKCQCS